MQANEAAGLGKHLSTTGVKLKMYLELGGIMHTIAYLFRRKSGLSREEFLQLYAEHRQVMLTVARGLVSYLQYPTRAPEAVGDIYTVDESDGFDALSIYTYTCAEDADYTSRLTEVVVDSERFIDFSSMISLPVTEHRVL